MNHSVSTFLFILVIVVIYLLQKGAGGNQVVDDEGVEVYRGDEPSASIALSVLNDQGIAAWIETEQDQHCIHIDPAQLETVQVLMAGKIITDD
ncbi:MAG: hypothetical protein HRU15_01675 [Planctomycetes bacterium]|nr:hypothetical protein [Planctomycetota bacterium]